VRGDIGGRGADQAIERPLLQRVRQQAGAAGYRKYRGEGVARQPDRVGQDGGIDRDVRL
jgi:hypothetical protein